jgi:hypothetical protein
MPYKNLEDKRAHRKRWYDEHRKEEIVKATAWSLAHPEKRVMVRATWRHKNADKVKIYSDRWREKSKNGAQPSLQFPVQSIRNEEHRPRRVKLTVDEKRARKIAWNKKWRGNNPDIVYLNWIKFKFGMSSEDYHSLLQFQGGVCAICKRPPKSNCRLGVDHDHATNEVRGLLCVGCNINLGRLGDSLEKIESLLESVFAYLRKPPTLHILKKIG